MKKILSIILSGIIVFNMSFVVYATDTGNPPEDGTGTVTIHTFVDNDYAQEYADDEAIKKGEVTGVPVVDEDGNPVIGDDGNPVTTIMKIVTDAEGSAVTDENGDIVFETTAPDSEGNPDETTVPNNDMEGQFETRSLSTEDLIALDRIKDELQNDKDTQFSDIFGTVLAIAGILIILYTFAVFVAYLIDKLNLMSDFECLRCITLNNAVTLRDEADRDMLKSENNKLTIMTTKGIIANTITGLTVGTLLTQSTKLLGVIEYIFNIVSG